MPDSPFVTTTTIPGGFRRQWSSSPTRVPQGRDTSFIRELLAPGGERLQRAACVFGRLEHLLALCEAGWLGSPRASVRSSLAQARERLCSLGAQFKQVAALHETHPGDIVVAAGTVQPTITTQPTQAIVWQWQERTETAYDFLLTENEASVLVRVHEAHLVAAPSLQGGDRITIVGFFDQEADASGQRSSPRGVPMRPVLRSTSSLPLLVLGRRP